MELLLSEFVNWRLSIGIMVLDYCFTFVVRYYSYIYYFVNMFATV